VDRRSFILALGAAALDGCATTSSLAPTRISLPRFTIAAADIPGAEGVATAPDGTLYFSSSFAAVTVLRPDGHVRHVGAPLAPNGIAVDPQGRVIVANMGLLHGQPGSLQRVDVATGAVETLVSELEGRALVASNSPVVARDGSIYCSHTKWGDITNIGNVEPSGFIYRVAPDGRADVVARGLRGVNGLCLDAGDRNLYAALTAEGRVVRFGRLADGALGPREDYGVPLGEVVPDHAIADIRKMPAADSARLGYCDGVAFDVTGTLWVTLPFAHRLVALTPSGERVDVVHDPSGAAIAVPTNLCWGGHDLRDLYVVCRGNGTIVRTRTAVAGLPMVNWPAGAALRARRPARLVV
jgi:gluconolactonase